MFGAHRLYSCLCWQQKWKLKCRDARRHLGCLIHRYPSPLFPMYSVCYLHLQGFVLDFNAFLFFFFSTLLFSVFRLHFTDLFCPACAKFPSSKYPPVHHTSLPMRLAALAPADRRCYKRYKARRGAWFGGCCSGTPSCSSAASPFQVQGLYNCCSVSLCWLPIPLWPPDKLCNDFCVHSLL